VAGLGGDVAGESTRKRGRELALSCLCHLEDFPPAERRGALGLLLAEPPHGDDVGEDHFAALASDPAVRSLAVELVELVIDAWPEVDAAIANTSKRWRLERMDRVDRNAIRIVAAELLHRPETPRAVILAEAVRLAARYGGERSPTFVNGLARALADALRSSDKEDTSDREGGGPPSAPEGREDGEALPATMGGGPARPIKKEDVV
jgi:N utilization substance protein B